MNFYAILTVFIGAGCGACLRYGLSLTLNPLFATVPLGTLASNLLGGYLAGAAAALFLMRAGIPQEYRLLVITGFLGGLTTFSTFSLELMEQLQAGRGLLALGTASAHLFGSLVLCFLGAATVRSVLA